MAIEEQSIIFAIDVKGQEKLDQVDKAVDKLGANNEKTKNSFFSLSGAIGNASNEIKNKITSVFPEAEGIINRTSGAFSNLEGSASKGAKGIFTLTNALKLIGGGVVTAIVAAVGALISYLKDLDPVVDGIERVMSGASAAVKNLGESLYDLITGATSFTNFFKNIGGSMSNAAKEAAKLKGELQDLEDQVQINAAKDAQRLTELAILNARYKAASPAEKVRINKQIAEIEKERIKDDDTILAEDKRILIAQIKNRDTRRKIGSEELEKLKEFNAEAVALSVQLKERGALTNSEQQAFAELQIKSEETTRKSLSKLAQVQERDLKLAEDAEAKRLENKKKLAEQKEKADEAERKRIAKASELEIQIYLDSIEDSTTKQIEALQFSYNKIEGEILEFVKDPAKQDELIKALKNNVFKQTNAILDAEEEKLQKLIEAKKKEFKILNGDFLQDTIKKQSDLSDVQRIAAENAERQKALQDEKKKKEDAAAEDKERQKELAKEILQSSVNLYNQISDARIESIDNEIQAQEQKIGRFRELAEFGTAEQLQLEEERLNELQIKREKEVERNRKIAAAQIAINQAVTLSNAITGVVDAFKNDPLGITTILKTVALATTIASLTASLGSVFGNLPAFKEGTPYVNGEGTETSDSILARLSKGERVLTAKQNRAIGAISNEDLTYYVKLGQSISDIEPQQRAADYTSQFNELVHENRLMRKKLDRLEIKMGITSEGIYGMITTLNDKENRKSILKA